MGACVRAANVQCGCLLPVDCVLRLRCVLIDHQVELRRFPDNGWCRVLGSPASYCTRPVPSLCVLLPPLTALGRAKSILVIIVRILVIHAYVLNSPSSCVAEPWVPITVMHQVQAKTSMSTAPRYGCTSRNPMQN